MAEVQLQVGRPYRVLFDGEPATGAGVSWVGPGNIIDIEFEDGQWVAHPLTESTGVTVSAALSGRTGSVTLDIIGQPIVITFEAL